MSPVTGARSETPAETQPGTGAKSGRLDALDGLRGVGALIVVVYHSLLYWDGFRLGMHDFDPPGLPSALVTMSPLRVLFDGRVAVLSFFVLSGFVLSRGFWRGKPNRWGRYYLRRLLRVYPPVLASGVLAVLVLSATQIVTDAGRGWIDLGVIGSSWTKLAENMGLLGVTHAPLNVVWWSMRWEVWFSLTIPVYFALLVLTGCGPRRRFRFTPLVAGVVCVGLVATQPWARSVLHTPDWLSRAQMYLPMFGVGVVLAAFEESLRTSAWIQRGRNAWWLLAFAVVLLSTRGPLGAMRNAGTLAPELATGIMQAASLTGVTVIVALLIGWPVAVRAMSKRPILWVGFRSYSLYLVHLPLIGLVAAVFSVETASIGFVAVCLAVSLAVMAGFYRLVEVPSTRLSQHFGRTVQRPRDGQAAVSSDPDRATGSGDPVTVGSASSG